MIWMYSLLLAGCSSVPQETHVQTQTATLSGTNVSVIPHELKEEIPWKYEGKLLNGVVIKSYIPLSPEMREHIASEFRNIKLAFSSFEGTGGCQNLPLEMRLVSFKQLNSSRFFHYIDPAWDIHGQYYKLSNILYFTPESFGGHEEYLEHEILHYLYDDCLPNLNEDSEHRRIDNFFRWLKMRREPK
jgi:hypothetical protein